jgi:hypothetical protein
MLQPVDVYDEAIADLMAAAGQQFVACLPHFETVEKQVSRWPPGRAFLTKNILLGNYMTAVLGNSDAYLASLLAALRFLMCGIEEDAAVALSAEDVAWMVSTPALCTRLGRAPFPDGQSIAGRRFPAQPTVCHFFHQSLTVFRTLHRRTISLVLSVHGPDGIDPLRLLTSDHNRAHARAHLVLAESFTPLPGGMTVDPPSVQQVYLSPQHITPTALDLNFELRVCRDRLLGAADRVVQGVGEGVTYTYVDHEGQETQGPRLLLGPMSPHLSSASRKGTWGLPLVQDELTWWS